jgi:putative ABC transport system ATP-binding protein
MDRRRAHPARRNLLAGEAMNPLIRFENVDHYYGDGKLRRQVLHGITAEVQAGEIVLLMGPSGSGKTTLLTLAGSLRRVQRGSVRVLGRELNGASLAAMGEVRRGIGFIFQAHNLLEALSAAQNVTMSLGPQARLSRREIHGRTVQALETVGLAGFANARPRTLSGGQKQRVAIARALVHRPQVILADEPTAALDRRTGREVVELLYSLAKHQGCAILMVTHDNRILDIADRILSLEDGRLSDFAAALTASTGQALSLFAQMWRKGELVQYIGGLSPAQFRAALEAMTAELERFLRVVELGNREAVEALLDQVLEAVTLKTRQVLNADRATLFLVDRDQELLISRVAHGDGGKALTIRIPMTSGIAARVANTGTALNTPDAYSHPDFNPSVDQATGYRTRSILCLPIFNRHKEVFAVAQLINPLDGQPFSPQAETMFQEFIEPLGVILESCVRLHLQSAI